MFGFSRSFSLFWNVISQGCPSSKEILQIPTDYLNDFRYKYIHCLCQLQCPTGTTRTFLGRICVLLSWSIAVEKPTAKKSSATFLSFLVLRCNRSIWFRFANMAHSEPYWPVRRSAAYVQNKLLMDRPLERPMRRISIKQDQNIPSSRTEMEDWCRKRRRSFENFGPRGNYFMIICVSFVIICLNGCLKTKFRYCQPDQLHNANYPQNN